MTRSKRELADEIEQRLAVEGAGEQGVNEDTVIDTLPLWAWRLILEALRAMTRSRRELADEFEKAASYWLPDYLQPLLSEVVEALRADARVPSEEAPRASRDEWARKKARDFLALLDKPSPPDLGQEPRSTASRPDRDTAGEAGGDLVKRLALANEVAQLVEPKLQKWLDWCDENEEAPEARSGAAVAAEVFLSLTKCRDDALAAANARVARLTGALLPLAAVGRQYNSEAAEIFHGFPANRKVEVLLNDLRRAAAAIEEK